MHEESTVSSAEKSHRSGLDTELAPRITSNLRLISNVYPSQAGYESKIHQQIRGGKALRAYLTSTAAGMDVPTAAGRFLTPTQQAQLACETNCMECGVIPEGPVRGEIQVRCPSSTCSTSKTFARFVNINLDLLQIATRQFAGDYSAAIKKALALGNRGESFGHSPPDWRQIPVRLTRTQHYLYGLEPVMQFSSRVDTLLRRLLGV